jgi:hypothetical protein
MYARALNSFPWGADEEQRAAIELLMEADVPRHQVGAMAATQRLTRKQARRLIAEMPGRR